MDTERQHRPSAVLRGVGLSYAGVLVSAVAALATHLPETSLPRWVPYATLLGSLALGAGLIYLVATGRNWARVTYAVRALLSFASVLSGGGELRTWSAAQPLAAGIDQVERGLTDE